MEKHQSISFSHFLNEPLVSLSLLTIGLVALAMAIMEFAQAIAY